MLTLSMASAKSKVPLRELTKTMTGGLEVRERERMSLHNLIFTNQNVSLSLRKLKRYFFFVSSSTHSNVCLTFTLVVLG